MYNKNLFNYNMYFLKQDIYNIINLCIYFINNFDYNGKIFEIMNTLFISIINTNNNVALMMVKLVMAK